MAHTFLLVQSYITFMLPKKYNAKAIPVAGAYFTAGLKEKGV